MSDTDRRDEIAVTPEMVEAGIEAYDDCFPSESITYEEIVTSIYVAMRKACRASAPLDAAAD